ncbi:hypothetical protein EXIGLDRAFT_784832 [Exidia glandulosa HHB12029]|uniref:Uncharacterized protein n=1 Tax=Exidia glandulosa HHB12029 TaxID=1314781 RepID=A0A166M9H9_EXIGL|nr:hypothetical protein EXIGLDRAFT_784832 [Exidia glandulosa HHB12029]
MGFGPQSPVAELPPSLPRFGCVLFVRTVVFPRVQARPPVAQLCPDGVHEPHGPCSAAYETTSARYAVNPQREAALIASVACDADLRSL